MRDTPKGLRLHIGVFGRRNVGKSSLLNRLVGQDVSIVSATPGTTTDPVDKTLELAPLGPVVFIDTAGIDDVGALGELRRERTLRTLDRTDLALLVSDAATGLGEFESTLASLFTERQIPYAIILNKADLHTPAPAPDADPPVIPASALTGQGIPDIRQALIHLAPEDWFAPPRLLGDLLTPGSLALLVVPIDLGAPKGRLILPQVQAIRDALDSDASALVVKERELRSTLANLKSPPALVLCDSQIVLKAAADTPAHIPLTTFSILMARFKGDLPKLAQGAATIPHLKPGSRVLIAEACAHHPLADDIGRVKIPRWLRQYAGNIITENIAGPTLPDDLSPYSLIIHCGACTFNRKLMLARIHRAETANVPITNYGLAISLVQGVLARTLAPFPAAAQAFAQANGK